MFWNRFWNWLLDLARRWSQRARWLARESWVKPLFVIVIDLLISFISFNIGKTIVAKRKIAKGDVISYEDVVVKVNLSFVFPHWVFIGKHNSVQFSQVAEPPGIDPSCVDHFVGKVAARDIEEDQSINLWQLTQLQLHLVQVTDGVWFLLRDIDGNQISNLVSFARRWLKTKDMTHFDANCVFGGTDKTDKKRI